MDKRLEELDWLKCVCILLMVAFHIVYFSNEYSYAKQLVYVFHMPVFFIISGYLFNVDKSTKDFLYGIAALAVPYIIMESLYIIAASRLPINEHIDNLTFRVFIDKLITHPIGPYWYLITLISFEILYYVLSRIPGISTISVFILCGLAICGCKAFGFKYVNALYCLSGSILKKSGLKFTDFFRASPIAIIPIILLAIFVTDIDKASPSGIIMNYLVISFLLFTFKYVRGQVRRTALHIGRETLTILLFSPLFTIIAKIYQPYILKIDSSGITFMLLTVAIAAAGSIGIKKLMTMLHIEKLLFLK